MKKQLLAGILMLGALSANSQILNGTFEDDASLAGWAAYDADGDGQSWGVYLGNEFSDSWGLSGNYVSSDSWTETDGGLSPDNYFISPVVAIPEGGATLTFLKGYTYYSAEDGEADQLSVYVITEANAPTIGDIAALEPVFNEVFNTVVPESRPTSSLVTVDLSAYAGQSVAIAFRHHDSFNQEMVFIDTVVITENTAGINNQLASQFNVFPNPASSVINIANVNALITEVKIADMNGRIVKSEKFNGLNNAAVTISSLSKGMYTMTLYSDKGVTTKKIIKK